MSTETERQVTNIIAPKQSATPGEGVTILAATTSPASTPIPDKLFGTYVYLQAEGDKIWVNFAPSAADAAISKAAAGGASFAAGTAVANAVPIPNGARIAVRLTKGQHDNIRWQADAISSKLIVYPTTPSARSMRGSG